MFAADLTAMLRKGPLILFCVLLVLLPAPRTPAKGGVVWVPAWMPGAPLVWDNTAPGGLVFTSYFVQQPNTTLYQLCAQVRGSGQVAFIVGVEGDPISVNTTSWETFCTTTTTGYGGPTALQVSIYLSGTHPLPMQAHGLTLEMRRPTIFVALP